MDTGAVRTLKQIVKDIHFEGGYGTDSWKIIGQFALNAIRELHMFHTKKYKVVKVTVDTQTNTVDWPDDYIGFCYLAVPSNGELYTLTRKNSLITTTTLVNGQETLSSSAGEGVFPPDGQIYGYGAKAGKNDFYYTEDENNRRFILVGTNPANVLLGYVSSGVEDKDTLVPLKYKECIVNFVRWKLYLREPVDMNKAMFFKDLYEQECNKLRAFEDPNLDEIYDAILSEYTATYNR